MIERRAAIRPPTFTEGILAVGILVGVYGLLTRRPLMGVVGIGMAGAAGYQLWVK